MSITNLTHYKKPSNRRRNSGELDVFEAAQYFSGYNDNFTLISGANMTPNIVLKEEKKTNYLRVGRRISLDMPSQRHHHHNYYHHNHPHNHPNSHHHYHHNHHENRQQIKEKKCKQQHNSTGGKLANFLNSLFNQTSSRKKKSSKSTTTTSTQSLKDEDESNNGRRRRRSSISHFWSSNNSVADAKSIYSSTSSGFRTPPPNNLITQTKPFKEFQSFAQHKDFLATLSKVSGNNGHGNAEKDYKTRSLVSKLNSVDEKVKSKNGCYEKPMNKCKMFDNGYEEKNKEINEFNEEIMDDGAESDSSSDLFELKIDNSYKLCSSGLSVYETTRMDNINISSGTTITIKN